MPVFQLDSIHLYDGAGLPDAQHHNTDHVFLTEVIVKPFQNQNRPPDHIWHVQPFLAEVVILRGEAGGDPTHSLEMRVKCAELDLDETYSSDLKFSPGQNQQKALLLVSTLPPVRQETSAKLTIEISCGDQKLDPVIFPIRYVQPDSTP